MPCIICVAYYLLLLSIDKRLKSRIVMVRLKSLKLEPLFQNKHATNRSCCLYSVAQCRFWCINLQYRTQLHSAIVAFCIVCVDMNDQYLNTSTVNVACSSLIYVICFPTQQGAAYKHYVYSASIVLFCMSLTIGLSFQAGGIV